MKHLVKTIVVVAAVLLAAGCTKETLPTPQPADQTRHVGYVKCGEPGNATVTGEEAWHALLDSLLTSAEGGCAVTFWDADLTAAQPTKETVTYSTASRDSAFAWGERMYDQGYTVSVIRDPITGMYNGSAAKCAVGDDTTVYHLLYAYTGMEDFKDTTVAGIYGLYYLINNFLSIAANGGCAVFWPYEATTFGPNPRGDWGSFTSSDRETVLQRCITMDTGNYAIRIESDYANGFKCNYSSMPVYQIQEPLYDYLPGRWEFTKNYREIILSSNDPFVSYNNCNGYPYDEYIVFTDTSVYLSALDDLGWSHGCTGTYEIIDDTTINIPFHTTFCGTISNTIQINHDTILICNYTPYGQINYLTDEKCAYWFMFARNTDN